MLYYRLTVVDSGVVGSFHLLFKANMKHTVRSSSGDSTNYNDNDDSYDNSVYKIIKSLL